MGLNAGKIIDIIVVHLLLYRCFGYYDTHNHIFTGNFNGRVM